MRAFLALEFPEELKLRYRAALDGFRRLGADWRWVSPDGLHLTLRFLGEIAEEGARDLREPVEAALRGVEPFAVALGPAGSFGTSSRARVLWIAPATGREELEELQGRLESVVRECGHPPDEKPWVAHVTVARRRSARSRREHPKMIRDNDAETWEDLVRASGLAAEGFVARQIALVSSRLTPDGPIHRPLWRAPLKME